MSQRFPQRWKSKFARFVDGYGTTRLASKLGVHPSAIHQWIRAVSKPKVEYAEAILWLAHERATILTLADIYRHASDLRASDPTIAITIECRKTKAAAREAKRAARSAAVDVLVKSLAARRRPAPVSPCQSDRATLHPSA
jgi:DNA-binding transcriptional regulator YdaS (Cro superfamily)